MGIELKLTDNTGLYLNAMQSQIEAALEAVGGQAETYAKNNLTAAGKVRHNNLRGHIAHEVRISEDAVYIGTNVEYAKYIEYGTGKFGENGGAGDGWWVYVPGGEGGKHKGKRYTEAEARQIVAILRSKGLDAHMTQGQKPTHFLKKAVMEHGQEYKQIVESILKNA